jgi:hypothetical protein
MSGTNGTVFRVELLQRARNEIVHLFQQVSVPERPSLQAALKSIHATLERQPTEWGDPIRDSKRAGGRVYRGIHQNLVVCYLVFHDSQTVFVLSIEEITGPETS